MQEMQHNRKRDRIRDDDTEARLSAVLSAGALLIAQKALHNTRLGSDQQATDQVADDITKMVFSRPFKSIGTHPRGYETWLQYILSTVIRRNNAGIPIAAVNGHSFIYTTADGKLIHCSIPTHGMIATPTEHTLLQNEIFVETNHFSSVSTHENDLNAAVNQNGKIFTWKMNDLNDSSKEYIDTQIHSVEVGRYVSVSTGHDHFIAVDDKGKVHCCGKNDKGQCGFPISHDTISHMKIVKFATDDARACSVSAGQHYSLVVTEEGKLYAFGAYPTARNSTDGIVNFPANIIIVSAAAGNEHVIALTQAGQVYAWGSNANGQLGRREIHGTEETPRAVFGDPNIVHTNSNIFTLVAASGDTSSAMTTDHSLFAWGKLDDVDYSEPLDISEVIKQQSVTAISINSKILLCVTQTNVIALPLKTFTRYILSRSNLSDNEDIAQTV